MLGLPSVDKQQTEPAVSNTSAVRQIPSNTPAKSSPAASRAQQCTLNSNSSTRYGGPAHGIWDLKVGSSLNERQNGCLAALAGSPHQGRGADLRSRMYPRRYQ